MTLPAARVVSPYYVIRATVVDGVITVPSQSVQRSGMGGLQVFPGVGGRSLTDYQNVVVVDPAGNGDYTTLGEALTAITDASASKRYLVRVYGKTVETANVVAKRYVDVQGGEITGAVQVQLAAGAVDDQYWRDCRIGCQLSTSVASARAAFWNCYLTGGISLAHSSAQIYFRNCRVAGAWNNNSQTSNLLDFLGCEVSGFSAININTVQLRACNALMSGASPSIDGAVTIYGGFFSASGSITMSGTLTLESALVSTGGLNISGVISMCNTHLTSSGGVIGTTGTGTLTARLSRIAGAANNNAAVQVATGTTVVLSHTLIENTHASGAYGSRVVGTPTLFRALNCTFLCTNASGKGLDADAAYVGSVYNSVISPAPATMTFPAGSDNVTF